MKHIGIFFGSDTGNTEKIAKLIQNYIGMNTTQVFDISDTKKEDIEFFDTLIFGVSTWYYGEIQCDWENFLPILKKINLKNKVIALFGCGDQEDYSEYFCDAVGIIYNIVSKKGAKIIGIWPSIEYQFESSKALKDSDNFYGMLIDEDRQPEKTEERVNKWVNQIRKELSKLT